MQNKTKNDGLTGGVTAHSARGPWPILVTTGVLNLKKKLFERKRSLCCESFLAGTQVQIQNLFVITVGEWSSYCQPREHLEQLCFSAHWTYVNVFWTEELCRILFLPICTSRIYSVHVYIFSKINIRDVEDTIQSVCGICIWPGRKKSQIYISNRIKLFTVRGFK